MFRKHKSRVRVAEALEQVRARDIVLADLCRRLSGRSILAVRYYGQTGEPLSSWMRDQGHSHQLDFGLELEMDDGLLLYATWDGPPCYFLKLSEGTLWPPSSEPGDRHDVSTMPPWPTLLGPPIREVRIRRREYPADPLGQAPDTVDLPVDAEFHLRSGESFIVSCRLFEPGPPESSEHDTDNILVTFDMAAARRWGLFQEH